MKTLALSAKLSRILGCLVVTLALASCATKQAPPPLKQAAPKALPVETTAATASASSAAAPTTEKKTEDPLARIREEGMNHSQVMETLSYLTDVIGPRLTGSPNLKHANNWTKEKMESWGLTNAHLEAWGPFGRGWTLEKFSLEVMEPYEFPIKAFPNAWSPGLDSTVKGDIVFLDATNTTQLDKYKGKLKNAIILASPVRTVPTRFDALSRRYDATNLLDMANATPPRIGAASFPPGGGGPRRGGRAGSTNEVTSASTNAPPARRFGGGGFGPTWTRFMPFLIKEGAALVLTPSVTGDAGTIFVSSASVPTPERGTNDTDNARSSTNTSLRVPAYATNAPPLIAQATVAVEDYNRLVRMAKAGEKLRASADLKVQFHSKDLMAYNTVAEIPGSDLKDQIIMCGAHMDSWHSGTGATDNAAGCAAMMEAVRILKTLNLQPRRTIRVALWSGEEEGLLGSKAYVSNHFGFWKTNAPVEVANTGGSGGGGGVDEQPARTGRNRGGNRELVKGPEHDKLSGYFNLDNGAGKIRGVYLQGNESMRSYFRKWFEPFRDLGAETITPSNTGGTDHLSFDAVGLPGFQFIQDPLDYGSRTHHSNEDVFDRVPPDDMKQAATIIATILYNAANLDEKLPRKPAE